MAHVIYTVKEGDCIASIAFKYGLFPETVWNDPKNQTLKDTRKNPNMLCVGDEVYVRELEQKEEDCESEERHRFRRKGVPEKLRLRLMKDGEPRAEVEYVLNIEGKLYNGKTDADGWLELTIPPDAVTGKLTIAGEEEYEVTLGAVPPPDTDEGIAVRLKNLGYMEQSDEEDEDDSDDEDLARELGLVDEDESDPARAALRDAITAFQVEHGLEITGEVDDKTREKIVEEYGA